MKKQVLITVLVAIFAFVIGYRADKTYDLKREAVKSNNTSSNIESNISSSKQETTKSSSSSQSSSSSKVELSPELEQRFGATFRNTKWGDSKETVKKYEKESLTELDEGLSTIVSLYGDKYGLVYMFKNDKLYMAGYMLDENLTEGGQYISEFDSLKTKLKEVYGEPVEDDRYQYGDVYEDNLGLSLSLGDIAYHTEWRTSDTIIELQLSAKDYKESLVIRYTDINYKDNPKDSGL